MFALVLLFGHLLHWKSLAKLKVYPRDTNQLDRIVDYAERGAMLYRQNGNPEAAAQLLEKAAKILEAKHPDKALTLYIHAAETVGTEGRDKEAAEMLTKVAKLQVKQKMWDKAKGNVQGSLYFLFGGFLLQSLFNYCTLLIDKKLGIGT